MVWKNNNISWDKTYWYGYDAIGDYITKIKMITNYRTLRIKGREYSQFRSYGAERIDENNDTAHFSAAHICKVVANTENGIKWYWTTFPNGYNISISSYEGYLQCINFTVTTKVTKVQIYMLTRRGWRREGGFCKQPRKKLTPWKNIVDAIWRVQKSEYTCYKLAGAYIRERTDSM